MDQKKYTYEFNEDDCFNKQEQKDRLEQQLGDFAEQLVMTALGRLKRYRVARVDHEGADIIATDKQKNGHKYSISVKARQFGFNSETHCKESEIYNFKNKDQNKLIQFSKEFNLIPTVALVLISCDFSYVDIYMMTLTDLKKLAEISKGKDDNAPESAIKEQKDGISINNFSLSSNKGRYYYSDNKKYLEYLQNNELIDHMRLDISAKLNKNKILIGKEEEAENIFVEDKNLGRQLGSFGEHLIMFALGQMKKYKVSIVDHVGADLIATDRNGKKYAISVKTKTDLKYTYEENSLRSASKSKHELSKLQEFADSFALIPAVAYVLAPKDLKYLDIYIVTLDNLLQIAYNGEVDGISYNKEFYNIFSPLEEWKTNLTSLSFSNCISNQKKLQEHKLIEHMRLEFKSMLDPNIEWS